MIRESMPTRAPMGSTSGLDVVARPTLPASLSALLAFIAIVALANPLLAAESDDAEPIPEPTQFVTDHRGDFNGERIDYRVIAGETYIRDVDDEPTAAIFSFAYIKTNLEQGENRPVTFVWNGGPGSASTWLHMGGYGPKRVVVPSDAEHGGRPPYPVVDAPETILDVSDLVFIDPVGTGFSKPLGEHEHEEFWGLNEDADSMAAFIRQWISDNSRWNSPRFLLGESFGTTRAAAVAQRLEGSMNIALNGIVFISQALDYQGSTPYVRDNIISHITYVPTMAATALYHGRVRPQSDQETFLREAREFATNEYLPALFKGSTITPDEYAFVRGRLAYFTGLSEDYIDKANLRVQGHRFAKELLREEGLIVGRLDSRYAGGDIDDLAAETGRDVASDSISGAYQAALHTYMREELGVDWTRPYLSPAHPDLGRMWRWRPVADGRSWEPKYVNTAHALAEALQINPGLRVMVASGYFDLVTPFFDAEYTLNRHDIPPEQLDYKYYQGGHMMYVHEPSRLQLLRDTREFIRQQM